MIRKNFHIILFLVIIFLSFGLSTQFSLWQDDNALIFKLQHIEDSAGFFGPGILGLGAYRYIALPYYPIYQLFGLNLIIFYIWALFFYFLVTLVIYFFAQKVTGNRLLAVSSAAIFAAGFIGSDGILRLFNSIQTSYSVILALGVFFFLYRLSISKKFIDYLLANLFFFLSLEFSSIRTQYLLFPIIIFWILFFFVGKKKTEIVKTSLWLISFIMIYYSLLLANPDPRIKVVEEFISGILSGQLVYTHSFWGTLGNMVIIEPISQLFFDLVGFVSLDYSNKLLVLEAIFLVIANILINLILKKEKFLIKLFFHFLTGIWLIAILIFFHDSQLIFRHSLKEDTISIFASFIGGLFLIIISCLIIIILKKDMKFAKYLIFLLSWLLFNILAYATYLPFSPLSTINRYLVHSLAAFSLFLPIIFYSFLKNHLLYKVVIILIVLISILFSINYQYQFLMQMSNYTKNFYRDLKGYVPEIKKGSVFYFDIADDEKSQQQFRDFFSVASMPDSTAIAVRYGVDRYDLFLTSNFEEFVETIIKNETSSNLVFSFFYKDGQLLNTSEITRQNLFNGDEKVVVDLQLDNSQISSVTPMILHFTASFSPNIGLKEKCPSELSSDQKKLLFGYLLSKKIFQEEVKVTASSQEKNLGVQFLIDGELETRWRGSRGWWHENEKEELVLDLGRTKLIGQLLWINGYANSTPIHYRIGVSVDQINWQEVKRVTAGGKKENNLLVIDNFVPAPTRFIKVVIEKTFDNDSPAISEIEAVEENFINIDKTKIRKIAEGLYCPKNLEELADLNRFINKVGIEGIVSWQTDKSLDNIVRFKLKADGSEEKYQIFLPSGGTKINNLKIESFPLNFKIFLTRIRIVYPIKEELMKIFNLQKM